MRTNLMINGMNYTIDDHPDTVNRMMLLALAGNDVQLQLADDSGDGAKMHVRGEGIVTWCVYELTDPEVRASLI